jgi:colicin import membrane protein
MRTAYIISGTGHAAVVLWSVWSLAARPLPASPDQALPIDIVSVSDFTKIMAGDKSAPKADTPKPLVEKVAEAKPVEDATAKIEQKEVKAVRDPAPAPETKPVEPKADKKQAEKPKPDQIAEALAKDDTKKPEPKKVEAKPPTPPKKPVPPSPKFDPKQIEAKLLDKRTATRVAAAGETLNSTASLGLSNTNANQRSLSELDALKRRLHELWTAPSRTLDPQQMVVTVSFQLKPDGTLANRPEVLNKGTSAQWLAARDSAIRALYRGQPFNMLKPEHYEQWKEIVVDFDPRDE